MAVISTGVHVLFLFWCAFTTGLSSARSVQQPSTKEAEDDVSMTQVLTPFDAQCDVLGCEYDLQLYCLDNGVIVMGSCSLKKTLCEDGRRNALQLANSWDSCFLASYTIILPHQSQQMTAAGGWPKSSQGAEDMKEEEEAGQPSLPDRDAADLINLQLERELLADPERDPAEGTVHGDAGGSAAKDPAGAIKIPGAA